MTATQSLASHEFAEVPAPDTSPWFMRGLCRDGDPDELFVDGMKAQKEARTLCFECPVRVECLADALNNRVDWGVWGGMTQWERRDLLRRSPDVVDWLPVLEKIQAEQDAYRAKARLNLVDLWRAKFERDNGE